MKQIKVLFLSQAWSLTSCLFKVFSQLMVLVPLGTEFCYLLVLSLHFFGNQKSFLLFLPVVPGGDECSLFKWFWRRQQEPQWRRTFAQSLANVLQLVGKRGHRPVVVMHFVLSCNRTVFLSGLVPHPHSMSDHQPFFTAARLAWSETRPACWGGPKFASLIHIRVLEKVDTSTNKPNFLSKPAMMMKHSRCECRHQLQELFFFFFFFFVPV